MWYTNIYNNIIAYQKYKGTFINVGGTQSSWEIQMSYGPHLESNPKPFNYDITMQAHYRLRRWICIFPCYNFSCQHSNLIYYVIGKICRVCFRLRTNATLFVCVYIFTLHFNLYRNTTQYWPRKTSIEFLISVFSSVVYSIWTRRW